MLTGCGVSVQVLLAKEHREEERLEKIEQARQHTIEEVRGTWLHM